MAVFSALLIAFTAAAGASEASRVAVLPLDPVRVPGDALLLLQSDLEEAVSRREDLVLVPPRETVAHLAAVRALGITCDRESVECQREIASLAAASVVVRGEARREEGGSLDVTLELWLTDPAADPPARGRVVVRLPAADDDRGALLDDALARLLEPEVHGATLTVLSDIDGARVSVDGVAWEEGATVVVRGLSPGAHEVVVEKEGHERFSATVAVAAGERAELRAALPPLPTVAAAVGATSAQRFGTLPIVVMVGGGVLTAAGAGLVLWGLEQARQHAGTGTILRTMELQYAAGHLDTGDRALGDGVRELRRSYDGGDGSVAFWAGTLVGLLGVAVSVGGYAMYAAGSE